MFLIGYHQNQIIDYVSLLFGDGHMFCSFCPIYINQTLIMSLFDHKKKERWKWLGYFLKISEWSGPFRVHVSQFIVRAKHNESSYILSKLKYIILYRLPWMFYLLSWKWKPLNLCSIICWSFLTQHWSRMPLLIKTMSIKA